MKVAESRITAPGVSLALHAGALFIVFLLGRTTVQFVPAAHRELVHLVAPPLDAPVIVPHQPPVAVPTFVQKVSIGVFDDVTNPDTPSGLNSCS